MGRRTTRDNRTMRCTRQMKQQLHRAWRTERMRGDGPWAPCEIIITLHDEPRAVMPHNASPARRTYCEIICRESVAKSGSATEDRPSYRFPSPRPIRKIRNSRLFLDNGIACASVSRARGGKKGAPDRHSFDLWVRGAREEARRRKRRRQKEEPRRYRQDAAPSPGLPRASSLFHNQRKIRATSAGLPRREIFHTL